MLGDAAGEDIIPGAYIGTRTGDLFLFLHLINYSLYSLIRNRVTGQDGCNKQVDHSALFRFKAHRVNDNSTIDFV